MTRLYDKVTRARTLLELPERATRRQIKSNYRRLLRHWHPDRSSRPIEAREKMTREIIEAYRIITAYCENYKYDFSEAEIRKYLSHEEWWMERFGKDAPWGRSG